MTGTVTSMVLEQFIDRKWVLSHLTFVFLISAVFVFVAFAVSELFFPGESVATILLAAILLTPSLHHLIVIEEKIESKGGSHFWKKHRTIFKCYLGAFLGVLAGFLVLGLVNPSALHYQSVQLELEHLNQQNIDNFLQNKYVPSPGIAISVFTHNLQFLILGFAVSIFYGAGAVFLIVFNASFFASFVIGLMNRFVEGVQLAGVSLVHLLPESAGFILTAIAGATLSRALIHEKVRDQKFRNVLQNVVKMLIAAVILLFIAAFVETYVTAQVFASLL